MKEEEEEEEESFIHCLYQVTLTEGREHNALWGDKLLNTTWALVAQYGGEHYILSVAEYFFMIFIFS